MSRFGKSERMRKFDVEVGRRIALTRAALRVKGTELAKAASISPNAVYNYEAGLTSCPPAVLSAFAARLGVSVAALVPKHTP